MRYLNEKDLRSVGLNWNDTIDAIEDAVACLGAKDFAQPVKPYLRYGDPVNRIIAMPAFVGGKVNLAGIKWIASFPENIDNGIPRAHAVVILNNAETGKPVSIINTALLSIIRTSAVSGLMIRYFLMHDLRGINKDAIDSPHKDKIVVVDSWQEAYRDTDIFITCTVSKAPYVDLPPKAGSLQLNCSLRDYSRRLGRMLP